ncbi:MAG: HlyD family efflux transporter periplasmic adaptor subunit [Clostridiales bacterium]|jgi:multidrug efflux pump subunit AcrA (membrane-fusion protein)|nr:HlyD family efflux transporter periplasmic adaptor subunit [Clostridiales bacterium]
MENTKPQSRTLKIVAAVSAAVLIILILLSKTIYTYNLPVVTATIPFRGTLKKTEKTAGVVTYDKTAEIYAEVSGKIKEVLVREGDTVTALAPIFELDFEGADTALEKQISALEADHKKRMDELLVTREKLNIDIIRIEANTENINRKIEELLTQTFKTPEVSDFEIGQAQKEIAQAEEDLAGTLALYEAGAVSKNEMDTAQRNITQLKDNLENLLKTRQDNLNKAQEDINELEKSRQAQLAEYNFQLESYEHELAAKRLDITASALQESSFVRDYETQMADLTDRLKVYENSSQVLAPDNCVVLELLVNLGQHIDVNQNLASFGLTSGYIIECDLPLGNNFTAAGDKVKLSNSSRTVTGEVIKITPEASSKKVTVSVPAEGTSAGETFELTFEKESEQTYTLVPNGAVNRDADGYFLSLIERRDGILGKEFVTSAIKVYIGDSDSQNTVITDGLTFYEPVALLSDKVFLPGQTVKLKNESDFFEN